MTNLCRKRFALALTVSGLALSACSAKNTDTQTQLAKGSMIDCPMRDAPYSTQSPLIDILMNEQAKAAINEVTDNQLSKLPPFFTSTKVPSFGAILSLETAGKMFGIAPKKIAQINEKLSAISVTDADRTARCARYDNDNPDLHLSDDKPNMLSFTKINGFYHQESVPAANLAFKTMAEHKGWHFITSDKGGTINAQNLSKVDVLIWNNISGDALTLTQRQAFKDYVQDGGAVLALHGSGGDTKYFWDWYADTIIGANFIGHPMEPQFQSARLRKSADHPIIKNLPDDWEMSDEWYSFGNNPRANGATILVTLDEDTYTPVGMKGADLRMGDDHPVVWTKCSGKGRIFYSALGHRAEAFSDVEHVKLLSAAVDWLADDTNTCTAPTNK